MATHNGLTRADLERCRGREITTTGGGFLATCDGPGRAVRHPRPGPPSRLRVGPIRESDARARFGGRLALPPRVPPRYSADRIDESRH